MCYELVSLKNESESMPKTHKNIWLSKQICTIIIPMDILTWKGKDSWSHIPRKRTIGHGQMVQERKGAGNSKEGVL